MLWTRLAAVRSYSIRVTHPVSSGSQAHIGTGTVVVELDGTDRIVWREKGEWAEGPLSGLRFHNSTTWERLGEGALRFSHLRRGDAHPTTVVTLVPDTDGVWLSEAPHLCGADQYSARVQLVDQEVHIRWEVSSPTDPYTMECVYR